MLKYNNFDRRNRRISKNWGIKNQLDVNCYFYFTYYLLNIFRTLICPSSGACDCVDGLPHRLSCSLFVVCWGLLRMMFGGVRYAGWSTTCFNLHNEHHQTSSAANPNTQRKENKITDVIIHQHSRKLLKMDILMSETCWANNKWNKNNKWHQVGF